MIVVKTYADVLAMNDAGTFPESFRSYVEREWIDLYEAYSDGEGISEFSLEGHGHQVCLELGDELPKSLGWPEYVDRVCLDDCEVYRMYVMETEDFGVLYYSIMGTLEGKSESYLKEHAVMNER